MSRVVLDGRRETRFGKLSAALQTLGEGFSRECALGDILLESRACEISADNALDIDTIRAPCDHRPSPQRVLFGIRKHEGGNVGGDKMVRDDLARLVEPEFGDPGQDDSLPVDLGRQDDIECRESVTCDKQEAIAGIVDVPDLPASDQGVVRERECCTGRHAFTFASMSPSRSNVASTF